MAAASKGSTQDSFKIGQRVIWTGRAISSSRRRKLRLICTVRSPRIMLPYRETARRYLAYKLEIDGQQRDRRGYLFAAVQSELRPLYDGEQPASWETCAWRPRNLEEAHHG